MIGHGVLAKKGVLLSRDLLLAGAPKGPERFKPETLGAARLRFHLLCSASESPGSQHRSRAGSLRSRDLAGWLSIKVDANSPLPTRVEISVVVDVVAQRAGQLFRRDGAVHHSEDVGANANFKRAAATLVYDKGLRERFHQQRDRHLHQLPIPVRSGHVDPP